MNFIYNTNETQIIITYNKGSHYARINCCLIEDTWHIVRLIVPAKLRCKRIGSKLLESAIEQMINMKNSSFILAYTSSFNQENKQVKFYIKHGFEFNETKGGFVKSLR